MPSKLRCPACGSEFLKVKPETIECMECDKIFKLRDLTREVDLRNVSNCEEKED